MRALRPYVSIDIQTTGRSKDKSEVLELAFVLDDYNKKVDELAQYNFILKLGEYSHCEPGAILVNQRLVHAAVDPQVPKETPKEAFDKLFKFITWASTEVCYKWDMEAFGKDLAAQRVCLAGKNIANFIVPVLVNFFTRHGVDEDRIKDLMEMISDRYIDVGSLYYHQFGFIPPIEAINKAIGRPAPNHIALNNALDNVYAIRHVTGTIK